MDTTIVLDSVYLPSEDVVARVIEGEIILIPLVTGIADMEDELFSLNETGKAIWDRLGRTKTLRQVVAELADEYEAPSHEIEKDVIGLVGELAKRRMVVRVRSQ